MRLCERNLKTFYYCNYTGKTEVTESGVGTGEYVDAYTTATACVGNVGGVNGTANENPFGILEQYDRTIIVPDTSCPITSTSVLFIDKDPSYDDNGMPEFDYYVVRAGANLGHFYILAKKV